MAARKVTNTHRRGESDRYLSVWIRADQMAALDRIATRERRPRAFVVREILDAFIAFRLGRPFFGRESDLQSPDGERGEQEGVA